MRIVAGFSLVLGALTVALAWYARDTWLMRAPDATEPLVLQLPRASATPTLENPPVAPTNTVTPDLASFAEGGGDASKDLSQEPTSARIEARSNVRWAGQASVLSALERFHAAKLAFESDPTQSERFENALSLARHNGWWTEVRGILARRINAVPDDAAAQRQLGAVFLRLSSAPEAVLALKRAIELDPDDAEAWYNLAIAEQTCRHLTTAREAWDETLRRMPNQPDALAHRGEVELDQHDWAAAEADLRAVLRAEPDQLDVAMNLALAIQQQDRLAEARALLEERLARWPEHVPLLNRLAALAADQALDEGPQRDVHLNAAREFCRRSLAAASNQPEMAKLQERIEQTARAK